MATQLWVGDVPDLVWYHRASEAELGLRALPIAREAGAPAPHEVREPTGAMQAAARRQRIIRRALLALEPIQRGVIACAYERELGTISPVLVAVYGRAAAVVLRAQARARETRAGGPELAAKAVSVLREAHVGYGLALRQQRAETALELEVARAGAQARRERLLRALAGDRAPARLRARAWLEEVVELMGRAQREAGQ